MFDESGERSRVSVADRLRDAHLSEERIAWWFAREEGAVRVDGESVTDPDASAVLPARVTLHS